MEQVDESALSRAQAAAQGLSNELLSSQEVSIINRLVDAYRRGKLVPSDAVIGLGVISELRSLRRKMEQSVQLGEEAARRITTRRHRP